MATYDKIVKITEEIKEKQLFSDTLASLIVDIGNSTNPAGDVNLVLTRTSRAFTLPATFLQNKLTNIKQNVDSDISALLAKVTIAP